MGNMKKPNSQSNNNKNANRCDGHGGYQRGSNIPQQNSPPPMPKVKLPKSDNKVVESNFYDQEEIYTNCTVQILSNSVTGEVSIGWYPNSEPPEVV